VCTNKSQGRVYFTTWKTVSLTSVKARVPTYFPFQNVQQFSVNILIFSFFYWFSQSDKRLHDEKKPKKLYNRHTVYSHQSDSVI